MNNVVGDFSLPLSPCVNLREKRIPVVIQNQKNNNNTQKKTKIGNLKSKSCMIFFSVTFPTMKNHNYNYIKNIRGVIKMQGSKIIKKKKCWFFTR